MEAGLGHESRAHVCGRGKRQGQCQGQNWFSGVPMWCSLLRIWCCHCIDLDSVPGPATSACPRCRQKKKKKNQCPCRAGTCRLLISWFKSRLWRHQAACHPVPSGLSLLPSEHEHSPGICLLARPLCLLCFPGPRTGRQEALGVPPDQHCVAKARGCCIGTGWVGYFQVWNYYFWIKTK